jgi:hypothetical protein
MTDIVGKLWGFCHTLRHDGIDYGDYIEGLTYFAPSPLLSATSSPAMSFPCPFLPIHIHSAPRFPASRSPTPERCFQP